MTIAGASAVPNRDDPHEAVLAAVRSVVGTTELFVPMHEPEFRGRERIYVADCIDTGWVSSVGSYVDRIERDLADITGVKRAIATANGTAALHICLLLAGVERDDEVLMPALTFVATANAAAYCGARPHFVDSETTSLGVDAVRLDAYLNEIAEIRAGTCFNKQTGARIPALVVMHTFGHPADLDALVEVAARWQLVLVEDAAESLGSFYKGRHTGNHGRISALSFNGNKLVTTGGGGAILTNDLALGDRAKHLTTTARVGHRWDFLHDEVGYNYRMPNLNAALGCAQLERLDAMLARKRELAARYAAAFQRVPGVAFLTEPPETRSNYWLNTIVLDDPAARDPVLEVLNDAGLMSRPIWTLMHRLPMYRDCPRADLGVAEGMAGRVINLPSSPKLAD
jgi:perosamine synthetase